MNEETQILTRWVDPTIDDFKIALEEANKQIKEDSKEIERLNNIINELIIGEIERLNNIIKEVREYIEMCNDSDLVFNDIMYKELIEILDKENKDE